MKDEREPLEAELASLRLPPVSPELRQRIAARLAENRGQAPSSTSPLSRFEVPGSKPVPYYRLLVGSLAAACLVAVVVWWGGGRGQETKTIAEQPQQPAPVEVVDGHDGGRDGGKVEDRERGDPIPSLLAYQRALARSPEELEALLNRHALVTPEVDPQLMQIGAYTRSAATLHALLGDN